MKNKCLLFIVTVITFFAVFTEAKAATDNCNASICNMWGERTGEELSERYEIHYKDGNYKNVFCLDKLYKLQSRKSVEEKDMVGFVANYSPMTFDGNDFERSTYKLGTNDAKILLKKIAIVKYYIYNDSVNNKTMNPDKKYSFVKNGIWDIMYETYTSKGVNNLTTSNFKAENRADYISVYNSAIKWYNEHKDEFSEPYGKVWQSDDNENQPIIDIDINRDVIKKYDYSLDIACTNCDSTNSDSKAFVIQDTTNWEAIFNSENAIKNSKCKGIDGSSYFKKSYGTYCREEYHVYFPNAYNRIKVQLGRFFTVNANSSEQHDSGYLIAADIPNFKPIKVKRVKECRGGDLKAYDNENKFENFKKNCIGKVYLKYNEDYYGFDKIELVRRKEPDSSHRKLENDILLEDVTYSYTLPNNTYQYIRMVDGKPVMKVPKDSTFKYINLGVGSLPVSFGNSENKDSNSVSVQLAYELPTNKCNGSSIAEMYKTKTCFSEEAGTKNVYKKFIEGTVDNNDRIENSACAKLYNTTDRSNTEFMNCVRERQTSKSNKCFNFNDINKSNYLCKLGDDCNDEKDAKKQGRGWNSCIKKCCPLMYKFNEANCTCEPCDGDDCNNCSKETPNRSWNKVTNSCCPVGQIYNETTKKCENGNGDDGCTEYTPNRSWNEAAKKCCPVGKVYSVKTKKCEEPSRNCTPNETECNGVCVPKIGNYLCPDSTSSDFVYRVVSLEQPFIGQSGANRKTGSNWCNFDSKTGKTNCESDNPVVKAVITNNKNISEDKAMYKVTLDAKTIRAVRAYNKKNKYDDWDLKCLKNGKACISDFIHKTVKVTGKCSNVGKDSFYTCAK